MQRQGETQTHVYGIFIQYEYDLRCSFCTGLSVCLRCPAHRRCPAAGGVFFIRTGRGGAAPSGCTTSQAGKAKPLGLSSAATVAEIGSAALLGRQSRILYFESDVPAENKILFFKDVCWTN